MTSVSNLLVDAYERVELEAQAHRDYDQALEELRQTGAVTD